jgi:hypothetical protein
MVKITINIADAISKEISSSIYDSRILSLESKLQDAVSDVVISTTPIEVLEISKRYPKFFIVRHEVTLSDGVNKLHYMRCRKLPSNRSIIMISPKDLAEIKEISDDLYAVKKLKDSLINNIYKKLLSLGTYERVESEFPVAYKYLTMVRESIPAFYPSDTEINSILTLAENY